MVQGNAQMQAAGHAVQAAAPGGDEIGGCGDALHGALYTAGANPAGRHISTVNGLNSGAWYRANRAWLRRHAIKAVIPVKEHQKKHRRDRGRAGGSPPAFDASWYKKRNTVTSASASTRAPSTSPRSASGCAIPFHDPRDTP